MTADYCLPPEQQKIYNGKKEVVKIHWRKRYKAHSAAYRLDEERHLAGAHQRLQTGAGPDPAANGAPGEQASAHGARPMCSLCALQLLSCTKG